MTIGIKSQPISCAELHTRWRTDNHLRPVTERENLGLSTESETITVPVRETILEQIYECDNHRRHHCSSPSTVLNQSIENAFM